MPSKIKEKFYEKLDILNGLLVARLDELFDDLDIVTNPNYTYLQGRCPIHGGDNATAFVVNTENHTTHPGLYTCYTHNCHKVFKPSLIGLVRGRLSHLWNDWNSDGDEIIPFRKAIDYACEFLNINWNTLQSKQSDPERDKSKFIKNFSKRPSKPDSSWIARETFINRVNIPSDAFKLRGFSDGILRKYCIGECHNPGKPFDNRVLIPIFDKSGKYVVNVTARTLYEICGKCNYYHGGSDCPSQPWEYARAGKWKHMNPNLSENLFNFHHRYDLIRASRTAIICESPCNVLRLEEAGVFNSVATFGAKLSNSQTILLNSAGCLNLILMMDNDPAGIKATEAIRQKYSRYYRIFTPSLPNEVNDVADMPIDMVTSEIKPVIDKITKVNYGF